MNTSWAEIVTNYAMVIIDDLRLQQEAATSPAQFLRRMSLYVGLAIPLLNRPPELLTLLSNGATAATYDETEWTSTQASTTSTTNVSTGITGYSLFSCCVRERNGNDVVNLTPYSGATYNAETGVVTFPTQAAAGIEYELDFYNDGAFGAELTLTQKRLAGLAIALVWDERFSRNWLNIQPKIHDSEFKVDKESTYMREVTNRLSKTSAAFYSELAKYEQDVALLNVSGGHRIKFV